MSMYIYQIFAPQQYRARHNPSRPSSSADSINRGISHANMLVSNDDEEEEDDDDEDDEEEDDTTGGGSQIMMVRIDSSKWPFSSGEI